MSQIELFGYCTSPFVRKVACFLYYKQLDFEFVPVNPVDPAQLAFCGGTRVPVLRIDGEWRRESTELGLWLDERFPARPIVPADPTGRERIMALDDWVSRSFLPLIFREAYDAPDDLGFRFRAWRLAALVGSQTPLPQTVQHRWPELLRVAPFIRHMMRRLDRSESLEAMRARIGLELVGHLGDGPFFGGLTEPSLVDLSIFPQVVFGVMAGLEERLAAARVPPVAAWLARMADALPPNPILVPDDFLVRRLVDLGL